VHWFHPIPFDLENLTQVQFQDHPQTGIQVQPPNSMFIALHSAAAYVLYLSGAIWKLCYDDEQPPITDERVGRTGLSCQYHQCRNIFTMSSEVHLNLESILAEVVPKQNTLDIHKGTHQLFLRRVTLHKWS